MLAPACWNGEVGLADPVPFCYGPPPQTDFAILLRPRLRKEA